MLLGRRHGYLSVSSILLSLSFLLIGLSVSLLFKGLGEMSVGLSDVGSITSCMKQLFLQYSLRYVFMSYLKN